MPNYKASIIMRKNPNAIDDILLSHKAATVIMAGGQGTRLFPLTQTRCKPDISFAGRYRLIDVPISNSLNSNVNNIFVISQFFASTLNKHISATFSSDPLHGGKIELLSPEETPLKKVWYEGTADAVRKNLPHLLKLPAEYYIILSGDQLYHMNLLDMLNFAKEQDADLTIATLAVKESDAKRMGVMKIDKKKYITQFFEKPTDTQTLNLFKNDLEDTDKQYLASMGIYIFKRSALVKLLNEDPREDFGKHLIPTQIAKKQKTAAYIFDGYWEDIGTIRSFYEANLALTKSDTLDLYNENAPIYAQTINLPSARLKDTLVHDSIICDGSIIGAKEISDSLIGMRSQIHENTIIKKSIVMGHQFYHPPKLKENIYPKSFSIGKNCLIQNSIIDEHTQIGDNVKLINEQNLEHYDGKYLCVRDGIIVVPSGKTIPNNYTF